MRLALSLALALAGGALPPLDAAEVNGTIVDGTGAPVPNARVELRTAGASLLQVGSSGVSGSFGLAEVPPGGYTLRVQSKDFAEQSVAIRVGERETGPIRVVLADIAPVYSNITVIATRGTVEEASSTPQVSVSTNRDDSLHRSLQTTAHALDGNPGILIQETTVGQSSPFLRGLTGYQTLLLIDGIRMNTSIYRSGPNQYFSFVEPSQVDRIEATLGPSGAAFGSDSMGGTVNVLTAAPSFGSETSGSRRSWHGELNLSGSTADLGAGWNARLSGGTARFGWLLGGSIQHGNDLRAGDGTDSRNSFRRYFGMDASEIRGLLGDRLPGTASSRYGAESKTAWRITKSQSLTLWYENSGLRGVRSYRDQLGGPGRLQSRVEPQGLNFGYVRYEKLGLGPLDSLTGTFSVNSQKDGTVQQALKFTDLVITNRSRVDSYGYAVQATAHLGRRQALLFGDETFTERVYSQRFNYNPVSALTSQDRAQYPNGSHYFTSSLFLQDSLELVPNRLRATGGIRYTQVRFAAFADQNRDRSGRLLGVVDSSRSFSDLTFNTSASWQMHPRLAWHVLVGRGFRAPNLNDLGSIGLTSLGYDVPSEEVAPLKAQFGLDSSDGSGTSGKYVDKLKPESLFNYETGFAFRTARLYARAQFFDAELLNPIAGRTLLFPAAAVPATIAGIPVTPIAPSALQKQQGLVAVATSLSPRAVKAEINDGHTKYYGTEWYLRYDLSSRWSMLATYSFMVGRDLNPNRPVRRLPPQQAATTVRYVPPGRRVWLEVAARASGAQQRLNGGDIDDDRIGASRRRSDIADFFAGGVVSGHLLAGADGRLGTADDIFSPTGETRIQIQNRVLPVGSTINGVTVVNDTTRVPLFIRNAGWFTVDVRAGLPLGRRYSVMVAVTNLMDRNYRVYGSGIDAPGFSAFAAFRLSF
jgi:hemoglobin/transferrin/lactoferrin receptor protein